MPEISIYIHIPFCLSKCSYCDFFSKPVEKNCLQINQYFPALLKELSYRISLYSEKLECKSVYIGGGTPSLVSPAEIQKILLLIKEKTKLLQNAEITIEVNPDDITENLLNSYAEIGINRISCGLQSMNDQILKKLNRRAGRNENLNALKLIKKYWKGKTSFDLISGLPDETKAGFTEGLEEVISYEPDHISMYSLTIEEETPLGQAFEKGDLQYDFDFSDELWLEGRKILQENGYEQYEVSNFCKPGNDCVHNLTYWNHKDYIGAGCGGTGTYYSTDGSGTRITNKTDIAKYIDFWTSDFNKEKLNSVQEVEEIGKEVSVFEYFMMGFRKLSGITEEDYKKTFGESISKEKLELFGKWKKDGLMNIEKGRYCLNSQGILLLNRLLEELI